MHRRLLRVQKAGRHADGLGTECRRFNEASAIAVRPHAIIGTSSPSTGRDNKTRDRCPPHRNARQFRNQQCQRPRSTPSWRRPYFLGYVYVKGTCVSTALFLRHLAMGIFVSDFGFVDLASGQFSFFKQGFDFEFGCPITLKV